MGPFPVVDIKQVVNIKKVDKMETFDDIIKGDKPVIVVFCRHGAARVGVESDDRGIGKGTGGTSACP